MGLFDGFIQKKERGIVAGQLEDVAKQIQTGEWKAMSPTVVHYLEGALWAAVGAAIPVLETAGTTGQFTKGTWAACASAALVGLAAYLRKNSFNKPDAPTP